jgi:sarcosine oxidase subunit alpha
MSSSARLPPPWGALIDRDRPLQFTFEGQRYSGFHGDTLASALAANGVLLISRSFKYHRPRGAWSFAGLDANAYVQVGDRPNIPADQLALEDGLEARAQNVWGSLARDRASLAGFFSGFMPAGFYYRAFFRPRGAWRYWEKIFRRSAGLGSISRQTGPGYFDKQYLFADVAVIGGGPAGLEAALAAARQGASVLLADEAPAPGGSLNYARFQRRPDEIAKLLQALVSKVREAANIRVLSNCSCSGWFADNWLSLDAGNRLFKLRAKEVIACTGSAEQPMVLRNNDLPGVLPASGVQRLLRLYGVRPGERVAVVTANLEGYDLGRDLLESGTEISVMIDLNDEPADPETRKWLLEQGIPCLSGHTVTEALAGPGKRSIKGILARPLNEQGLPAGKEIRFACDSLVTSAGYAPLAQIVCHSGGRMVYDGSLHSFKLEHCPPHGQIAGSVNHRYTLEAVRRDGRNAGLKAAAAVGHGAMPEPESEADSPEMGINHPCPVFPHPAGKDFVDFDEDLTVSDLENAVADGFDHPELAKRYSTAAMGPSQGRLSALNVLRIVQRTRGSTPEETEATTQRPPFKPASFGVLAGRSFEPERLTPMHHWHLEHGAAMMPAGLWQRPAFYGAMEEKSQLVPAEVGAVRENVGIIDVSTLGGIEVRGPDAARFLNRMYTFAYTKQAVGSVRYVLMTDDTGSVVDDGIACRRAQEHFHVTTTTTGSDAVYRGMLRRIAQWRLDVDVVNVTSVFAAMNLAGPKSRQVIEQFESDIDFSDAAFPYLAARHGRLCGVPVLAMRVGFVGELGYELHVPWSQALSLWEQLVQAGEKFGLKAVGVEAQRVLRLEKGHIIIGQDTDGLTHPHEAGLEWAVSRSKGYFVGGPALDMLNSLQPSRKLTGFRLVEPGGRIPDECHLVIRGNEITGRVTSVARSEALDSVIGLAYVAPDQAVPGQHFEIKTGNGKMVTAEAVEAPFYDPDNLRQRM